METFVPKTSSHNVCKNDTFERRQVHFEHHSPASFSFLGPKIWDLLPVELKQSDSIDSFKLKIKNWIPLKYMTNQLIKLNNCLFQLLVMGVLKVFKRC